MTDLAETQTRRAFATLATAAFLPKQLEYRKFGKFVGCKIDYDAAAVLDESETAVAAGVWKQEGVGGEVRRRAESREAGQRSDTNDNNEHDIADNDNGYYQVDYTDRANDGFNSHIQAGGELCAHHAIG